jgi:hypothetical protein
VLSIEKSLKRMLGRLSTSRAWCSILRKSSRSREKLIESKSPIPLSSLFQMTRTRHKIYFQKMKYVRSHPIFVKNYNPCLNTN